MAFRGDTFIICRNERSICFYNLMLVAVMLLLTRSGADAEQIRATRNFAVVAGDDVSFRCEVNRSMLVQWNKVKPGSHETLFNGNKVSDTLAERILVNFSTELAVTQSTMMIRNIKMSDAGTYGCSDLSGINRLFELTVIESGTICATDRPTSSSPSLPMQLTCRVNYSGNCAPAIGCWTQMDGEYAESRKEDGQIIYTKRFKSSTDKEIECITIVCSSCYSTCADDVQIYRHIWKSAVYKLNDTGLSAPQLVHYIAIAAGLFVIIMISILFIVCFHKMNGGCTCSCEIRPEPEDNVVDCRQRRRNYEDLQLETAPAEPTTFVTTATGSIDDLWLATSRPRIDQLSRLTSASTQTLPDDCLAEEEYTSRPTSGYTAIEYP